MITMDQIECKQIIAHMSNGNKVDLVRMLIEQQYSAIGCILTPSDWSGGYSASFKRKGKLYNRNILIVQNDEDYQKQLSSTILCSMQHRSSELMYNSLDCFIFTTIQNTTELEEDANLEYSMKVTIHDLDAIIANVMSSSLLSSYILPKQSEKSKLHVDRKSKILYDLFTAGANIANIKNGFISSYIQYELFTNGKAAPLDLFNRIRTSLPTLQRSSFDDAIQLERAEGRVFYNDGALCLTNNAHNIIENLIAYTTATEQILLEKFEQCLAKFGVADMAQEIMRKVTDLYKTHYDGELAQFDSNERQERQERQIYNELQNLLLQRVKSIEDVRKIVNEILEIVGENEYLNKTSLTCMFTSMFNSNQLEEYMSKQTRVVLLDTQILLQYLCLTYQDIDDYNDSLYDSVKILRKQFQDSHDYISLCTTDRYIQEVVNHLWEAHSLRRFLSLSYIKDMGPSKNVFFNFYLQLEKEMSFEDFDDFLCAMLEYNDVLPNGYNLFKDNILPVVTEIFELAGISVKTLSEPENLVIYQRAYDNILADLRIYNKNPNANQRDVLCALYLSDENNFINTVTSLPEEPFFVTLDTTMLPLRECMKLKFQRKRYFVYPPLKFANRLSVMNLKLDSKKINYNIICLTEQNFKTSNDTISMIDVMSSILNSDNITELRTPQRLAALKRTQMDDVRAADFAKSHHDNLPIDFVLNEIHRHYRNSASGKLKQLTSLFQNNDATDELVRLLTGACQEYQKEGHINKNIYNKIDAMLKNI